MMGLFLYHAGTFITACSLYTNAQWFSKGNEQGRHLHVHTMSLDVVVFSRKLLKSFLKILKSYKFENHR